jgi:hypothetical protein
MQPYKNADKCDVMQFASGMHQKCTDQQCSKMLDDAGSPYNAS